MEARLARVVSRTALLVGLVVAVATPTTSTAAGYKTANFVVSAPTPQLAKEIGDAAEMYRRTLAIEWLGQELPNWSKPCPIHAQVAPNLGAGGATSFIFDRGQVFGWKMNIQGSRERVLDSVLPHEVTHTIFASYFRRPLPRWADEGACTTVENPSEIAKQERNLVQFLKTNRGIPFSQMFAMKEYPPDVMPLYAQGHSVASWLIEARGRQVFLDFLADGMQDENWPRAVRQHYGYDSLMSMQTAWNDWVRAGRPRLAPATGPVIAANTANPRTVPVSAAPANQAIYRGQSPDRVTPVEHTAAEAPRSTTPVSVASASGSVYAEAAARAERERQQAPRGQNPPPPASIYDSSRDTRVLRR